MWNVLTSTILWLYSIRLYVRSSMRGDDISRLGFLPSARPSEPRNVNSRLSVLNVESDRWNTESCLVLIVENKMRTTWLSDLRSLFELTFLIFSMSWFRLRCACDSSGFLTRQCARPHKHSPHWTNCPEWVHHASPIHTDYLHRT